MRSAFFLIVVGAALGCMGGARAAGTLADCEALRGSEPSEAVTICSEVIAAGGDPATISRAYASRGYAYIELKQYLNALADESTAIGLDPANDFAWHERGWVHNELGRYDEAIRDLSEALRLNPERAVSFNERGYAYDKLGRYGEAVEDYTAAIAIVPEKASYFTSRAKAYEVLGKSAEAAADRARAAELEARAKAEK